MADITKIADDVIGAVKGYVERAFKSFESRIDTRIKALEDRPLIKGEKGDRGETGEAGAAGRDGHMGADGERGPQGEKGEKGDTGSIGPQGPAGEAGGQGPDGRPGPQGERGEKGEPGRDGLEGQPGKDALQIEVLQDLDPEKKYRRNTYAAFRGGMIRSFRATDPITDSLEKAGWHVILNGTDEIEETREGRDCKKVTRLTDGRVVEVTWKSKETIYAGIFKDGQQYDPGDQVTRDGCTWTLMSEMKGYPGEPNKDTGWQMSAKKGRDGRDGIRGEKGDRGAEGRAGKDAWQT
jgi:hypothetical protein